MEYTLDKKLTKKKRVVGFGVDLCQFDRIRRFVERYDAKTLGYLFTINEYEACTKNSNADINFASFFAIKEAFSKALGTGMAGMRWTDIELSVNSNATYSAKLKNIALQRAKNIRAKKWNIFVSIFMDSYICAEVILYASS